MERCFSAGYQVKNPDLLIAEHLGKKDKVKIRDWGYTYAPVGGYWGGYWGSGGVSVYEYEEGSLRSSYLIFAVWPNSSEMICVER